MTLTPPLELSGMVDVQGTKRSDDALIDSGGNFGCKKTWLDAREMQTRMGKYWGTSLGHGSSAAMLAVKNTKTAQNWECLIIR